MKKTSKIVKSLFAVATLAVFLGASSCKNEQKPEDTKEVAEDANEATFNENDNKEDDSEFLVAAAETDMMEIEVGKLALTKSTNPAVKEFATILIADHTKSAADTKPFADRLQVTLPAAVTEKGQERYADLNKESGKDFDKKFADLMVEDHQDAVDKMEKAAKDANDPEVKAWAAKMVPTLQGHLQHAKTLKDQVNK